MQHLTKFAENPAKSVSADTAYLGVESFSEHCDWLIENHPSIAAIIEVDGIASSEVNSLVAAMNRVSWEFEDEAHGRGQSYNSAQRAIDNRAVGMRKLLALFSENGQDMPGKGVVILDALAGDGTIRRFASSSFPGQSPEIICADISQYMIKRCREQNYPCLRQSAAKSFVANGQLDGVLIAYGSHHLSDEERLAASKEAHRTLKTGGRFVLHDFPEGGKVDEWFSQVVHKYSRTGHPHRHFNTKEMEMLLSEAGFVDRQVVEMSDPFVVQEKTEKSSQYAMLNHLHAMYGLHKLPLKTDADAEKLNDLVRSTLGEIRIMPTAYGFKATLDRTAIVAVGTV